MQSFFNHIEISLLYLKPSYILKLVHFLQYSVFLTFQKKHGQKIKFMLCLTSKLLTVSLLVYIGVCLSGKLKYLCVYHIFLTFFLLSKLRFPVLNLRADIVSFLYGENILKVKKKVEKLDQS